MCRRAHPAWPRPPVLWCFTGMCHRGGEGGGRAVLNGENKSVPEPVFPKKPAVDGCWRLAVDGCWRLAVDGCWRLAVDGSWRLAVDGCWRLAVDGCWRLAVDGCWRLAVDGCWRLAVDGCWRLAVDGCWRLAVDGCWRLAVDGYWRLAVDGCWRLAVDGCWRLAVDGCWRLAVDGCWRLAVDGYWRLVVDGCWRLAVGGPLGRSLAKKKKSGPLRTALGGGGGACPGPHAALPVGVRRGTSGVSCTPTPAGVWSGGGGGGARAHTTPRVRRCRGHASGPSRRALTGHGKKIALRWGAGAQRPICPWTNNVVHGPLERRFGRGMWGHGAAVRDALEGGGEPPAPPPPSRAPSLCPATVPLTPNASLNGICNRQ